jgi:hypothetical protein
MLAMNVEVNRDQESGRSNWALGNTLAEPICITSCIPDRGWNDACRLAVSNLADLTSPLAHLQVSLHAE